MNGLMLHCGANNVTRDAVFEVRTPEPTESHYPVPHTLLLEQVEKNLKDNGFEIVQESHALTQEGMRYFGLLEVRQKAPDLSNVACLDDPTVHPDYGLVIGIRNTHDMSYAAALAMGNRVLVCDNLSFSGEVLIGRRHTRNIARDIPLMIPRAFSALSVERVNMETRIECYKDTPISNEAANDFIVRSIVDEKVFPVSTLPKIVQEWRNPAHDAFKPRTVWSLVNSFTEVAKPREVTSADGTVTRRGGNIATLMGRTNKLYGFFDKNLGVVLKSREELREARDAILVDGKDENTLVGYEAARVNRLN